MRLTLAANSYCQIRNLRLTSLTSLRPVFAGVPVSTSERRANVVIQPDLQLARTISILVLKIIQFSVLRIQIKNEIARMQQGVRYRHSRLQSCFEDDKYRRLPYALLSLEGLDS